MKLLAPLMERDLHMFPVGKPSSRGGAGGAGATASSSVPSDDGVAPLAFAS